MTDKEQLEEWEKILYEFLEDGYHIPHQLKRPRDKQTRLFIDNEFLEGGYSARFKGSRVLDVYGVLCKHANAQTQICWPSYNKIMELTGIKNRNTITRALKILEDHRIIFTRHSRGKESNRYLLVRAEMWLPPNGIAYDTDSRQMRRNSIKSRPSVSDTS